MTGAAVPLRVAELCAGYGGLYLSLQAAGWPVELAWYAENDPDASAVMAAHHEGVRNVGDITTALWWECERVDILAAGYPCTDISNAGKRAGIEGEKSGIWRNVADAVRVLRPRLVLLENVGAHLARGFGRVLGDLAGLGYDAQWTCLRASDVGAPHQRNRVFIVAFPTPADAGGQPVRIEPVPLTARSGTTVAGGDREDHDGRVADLLPTPTANLARGGGFPSPGLAAARRADGRRMLDDAVALLPTPMSRDGRRGSGYGDQPGRPLSETVTRLLPTPTASDGVGGAGGGVNMEGSPSLRTVVPALLPTPRATDAAKGGPNQAGSSGDLMLPSAVARLLPTPNATDAQGGIRAVPERRTHDGTDHGPRLRDVAPLLPTPTVANWHGNDRNGRGDVLLPGAVEGLATDRWAQYGAAIRRWEDIVGRPAPDPTVTGKKGGQRLSGRFVEWLMGLPDGWLSDVVDNNAAVRLGGNGVVPLQGAAAFLALTDQLRAGGR